MTWPVHMSSKSWGTKDPPEPFKFGDIVQIEKKVHTGYWFDTWIAPRKSLKSLS